MPQARAFTPDFSLRFLSIFSHRDSGLEISHSLSHTHTEDADQSALCPGIDLMDFEDGNMSTNWLLSSRWQRRK